MANKRRFKATIDGQDYTIIGDASTEHMQAVTEIMNQQIEQLKALAPTMSKEEIAILMAFNAISDQVKKETELVKLQKNDAEA